MSGNLKIAFRNLLRNKLYSGINLGGLIIGFTIGTAVLAIVYMQLKADRFHDNLARLYQAYQVFNYKEGRQIGNNFGFPQGEAIRAEAPSVKATSRFSNGGGIVEYNGRDLNITSTMVDADFLQMFSFPVLRSIKTNPLAGVADVVLTENAAKKIFGDEEPIGKIIKVSNGRELKDLTVTAILRNVPGNSSIKFDVLFRIENSSNYAADRNQWANSFCQLYVQLKDGASQSTAESDLKFINRKYIPDWQTSVEKAGGVADARGDFFATRLLPMKEVHFSTEVNKGRAISKVMIYSVLTVGLLIILIASFNFVNINLANAYTRTREIGVKKCLGAGRNKLFGQLWTESFLLCLIASVLSMMFVHLALAILKERMAINDEIGDLLWEPGFLGISFLLVVIVSFIAGGYPSWKIAGFRVAETLKGNVALKRNSILRSTLIVAQFTIACALIGCTFVIYRQFNHLQNADIGIDTGQLISVPVSKPEQGHELVERLRSRLADDPRIISITGSSINIGKGVDRRSSKSTIGFTFKDREVSTNVAAVDYDYLKTLGMTLIDGRDFDKAFRTDTAEAVIISEAMAAQLQESNPVGQQLQIGSGWKIIGVYKDFHMYSMREANAPMTLTLRPAEDIHYVFIRTGTQNLVAGMELVKKEMAQLEPGKDFRGSYVDENIKRSYEEERVMSISFSVAAIVSIVLSCTGLLAMALLIIQQRLKEIGIRKVLGASVTRISLLLTRDFLKLVIIAVLIATPVSWMIMDAWLRDFSYRIPLSWWNFAIVGLAATMIALSTIAFNTVKAAMQNPVKSLKVD